MDPNENAENPVNSRANHELTYNFVSKQFELNKDDLNAIFSKSGISFAFSSILLSITLNFSLRFFELFKSNVYLLVTIVVIILLLNSTLIISILFNILVMFPRKNLHLQTGQFLLDNLICETDEVYKTMISPLINANNILSNEIDKKVQYQTKSTYLLFSHMILLSISILTYGIYSLIIL